MTQVFLQGAYKYPRELTWVLGVFLFLLTLGMAFTGQILRWDPDAYWGLGVGASMAGRVPYVGPEIVQMLLGGAIIGGDTLSRFFTLHVFVIPGLLLVILGGHLYLVLKKGISEFPKPGELVNPATYDAKYHKELEHGVPFLGEAIKKDIFFSALTVFVVCLIAATVGPKGPTGPPDPTLLNGVNPRPDWAFLWLFGVLSLSPDYLETFIILVFPVVLVIGLLAVPFISNRGERSPSRRPLAVLGVVVIFSLLIVFSYLGAVAPWSPVMEAWSGIPVPEEMVKQSNPRELQGALIFQYKNCRNCHCLDGKGGLRGPDLTFVGARLTPNLLIDQISNGTPGGGNMPAFGKQISPAEMAVLVDFLTHRRPPGEASAQPSATAEVAEVERGR
jgi:ubiquinol-cytochrome c reductase cytochrome b subunit